MFIYCLAHHLLVCMCTLCTIGCTVPNCIQCTLYMHSSLWSPLGTGSVQQIFPIIIPDFWKGIVHRIKLIVIHIICQITYDNKREVNNPNMNDFETNHIKTIITTLSTFVFCFFFSQTQHQEVSVITLNILVKMITAPQSPPIHCQVNFATWEPGKLVK